ncbi:hypothetical protein PFISCL1PPCAC_1854, partial [Pristionchus fissidentatus]
EDPERHPRWNSGSGTSSRSLNGVNSKLFICNLPKNTNNQEIHDLFSEIGKVESVRLLRFPDGSLKGYGFVRMEYNEDAREAVDRFRASTKMRVEYAGCREGPQVDMRNNHRGDENRGKYERNEKKKIDPPAFSGRAVNAKKNNQIPRLAPSGIGARGWHQGSHDKNKRNLMSAIFVYLNAEFGAKPLTHRGNRGGRKCPKE